MPLGVVTVTGTVAPAVPADDVTEHDVAEHDPTMVPGVEPNCTLVAPARLAPVMVTDVPPAAGPASGTKEFTAGRFPYEN